jgi:hypothetical protein
MIWIKNKKGVAILTVLFFLVIVTLLATGAIMLATVQLKVSGSIAQMESARSTAEGAINYIIPLVESVHHDEGIPAAYNLIVVSTPTPTTSPDPRLVFELTDPGQRFQNDVFDASPNINFPTLDGFTVTADVDALDTSYQAGGLAEGSCAYCAAANLSMYKAFKITARASSPGGRYSSVMQQVIWLRVN